MSYLSELMRFLKIESGNNELSEPQQDNLQTIIKSLTEQIPVEYLVGEAVFLERRFKVTKDVLIPRFDTETLVTRGIGLVLAQKEPISILDLGTGSGAIIISLAKELTNFVNADFHATDISAPALAVAEYNARIHNVSDRINFHLANVFPTTFDGKMIVPSHKKVLIVTNPPYISDKNMATLPRSVKNYEPDLALRLSKDFLVRLDNYLTFLSERKKTIYLYLEYGNLKGHMVQYFVDNSGWTNLLNSLIKNSS